MSVWWPGPTQVAHSGLWSSPPVGQVVVKSRGFGVLLLGD